MSTNLLTVVFASDGATFTSGFLSSGDYILEIEALTDPPFTIEVFSIPITPPLEPAEAPEPGALALLLTGVLALAAALRRRMRKA